jgi:D-3-phosphoglycerate dehydrogenase / 2-oxoglutarate reductase
MKPVIASTHPLHPLAAEIIGDRADLRVASSTNAEDLIANADEADILIVRANLPPALFGKAKRLKAAIRHGAGLDMIPMEACTAAGVLAANVPGANALTVAEHVLMVAMLLLRKHRSIDARLRAGIWQPARDIAETSSELSGRTLGIVGFGAIGAELAQMAGAGFRMRVLAHRRSDVPMPQGVTRVPLDALLAQSDIVVLACPLTDETRGLMNAARLRQMKPSALLINVARGPVVDEPALIKALQDGVIAGAGLDVFATQPLPLDHPFRAMENVVLTPHLAGITDESMARIVQSAVEQAFEVLAGKLPKHLVNAEALPLFRQRFPDFSA